ncbi:hypothetical protein DFS33DRAFT_1382765 [Desarmillaria ectypa]|nr:hypothetical protein DFS33DRAFT_1382765 [Desarmillaria ectypa]
MGHITASTLIGTRFDVSRHSLSSRIHAFDVASYNTLHQTGLAWLCGSVETIRRDELHRRVVMLTRHAPTIEGTGDPKYTDGPTSSAFARAY